MIRSLTATALAVAALAATVATGTATVDASRTWKGPQPGTVVASSTDGGQSTIDPWKTR